MEDSRRGMSNWLESSIILACAIVLTVLACLLVFKRRERVVVESEQGDGKKGAFDYVRVVKVLAIVMGVFCAFRLAFRDAISSTTYGVIALQGMGNSNTINLIIIIIRIITQLSILLLMVSPFFKLNRIESIVSYVAPVAYLLNIIFFNECIGVMSNYQGSDLTELGRYTTLRTVMFAIECVVGFCTGCLHLFNRIINRQFEQQGVKNILITIGVAVGLALSCFPESAMMGFFGEIGPSLLDLELPHRIALYITFSVPIILYMSLRNKSYERRNFTMTTLAIAGFMAYFYQRSIPIRLYALPLHMCNTAMILMLFSFILKSKKLFYFNYFVNVVGAFAALLMPTAETAIFNPDTVQFWYNHIYAVILPILGVALHIFPRPNMKMIWNAIWVFSIYFVVVAFIDSYVTNINPGVDYFFLNSDFLLEKFPFAAPLKANYTYQIPLSNGYKLRVYPLFWLAVYVVYIGLMFGEWFIYAFLYSVSDNHYILLKKKREIRMDMLGIKGLLAGRAVSQPAEISSADRISIRHFSKIYSGSNRKAVDDFSLEVPSGTVYGFLGHNGAGKSTVIKSLVGIQTITEGSMYICGYDVAKQPLYAKQLVGYVSDNHVVYERLTGREYIDYVANLYLVDNKDKEERLSKYLKMFNLENAIDNEVSSYSHGMRQKLVVISSLIHNPKVWILDEPLTGLDPTSSMQVKQCMIEHARKGNIVFFSSHVIEVVEKVCDRICIIGHGRKCGEYDMAQLRRDNISLEKIYLDYSQENNISNPAITQNKVVKA